MKDWIEVPTVAKFKPNKPPEPIKIRVQDRERLRVIAVDKISFIELRNANGEEYYMYGCQSYMGSIKIMYYMQYWISEHKWKYSLISSYEIDPRSLFR